MSSSQQHDGPRRAPVLKPGLKNSYTHPRPVLLAVPGAGMLSIQLPPLHTIARKQQEAAGIDTSTKVEMLKRARLLDKLKQVAKQRQCAGVPR